MKTDGFWNTLEVACICSDFRYSQYQQMHATHKVKGAMLCAEAYMALKDVINRQMEDDKKFVPTAADALMGMSNPDPMHLVDVTGGRSS